MDVPAKCFGNIFFSYPRRSYISGALRYPTYTNLGLGLPGLLSSPRCPSRPLAILESGNPRPFSCESPHYVSCLAPEKIGDAGSTGEKKWQ